MEEGNWFQLPLLLFTSSTIFLVCSFFFFFLEKHVNTKTLPPSPPSLPLIGHLHLLKEPFPRTLHELTSKYGRVLFLRFGCRKILVVSSASAVEECFTKYDAVFADRPRILASQILNCGNYTLGFAPYGAYWRNLRKFMTIEVFIPKSVASFSDIRQAEAYLLVKQLFNESGGKTYRVRMRSKLVDLAFNIIMRILMGQRYSGGDVDSKQGRQIKEVIKELGRLQGSASHIGDLAEDGFPRSQEADVGVEESHGHFLAAPTGHATQIDDSSRKTCLINRMLSKQQNEPDFYSDKTIKAVLQTMLVAGTDTTSTTAEWALFLLLNHPEALAKAQTEIDSVFGHSRLVDDASVQNLPYLQSIITETLRLFPPVPLLLPHESTEDSTVCGFHVPRRTTLLVNLRSIHRDPDLWADPERFIPERFQHGSVVGGSEGYKWMAFGVGRRACPGATFGRKVLGLALAAMLQCFEWRRIGPEAIDIVEGTGLTMPPATPVEALCKPRDAMVKLLASLEVSEGGVGDA